MQSPQRPAALLRRARYRGGARHGRLGQPQASAGDPPGGAMSGPDGSPPSVVIVGGGFAGVGCAKELAKHDVAGHAARPQQLPPVPAAALPGGHRRAGADRRRPPAARRSSGRTRPSTSSSSRSPASTRRPARSRPPTARRSPATTSCWRPARGRTSSARPGAEQHAFPLYSVARRQARCAPACSRCSRRPTPTRPASTRAR